MVKVKFADVANTGTPAHVENVLDGDLILGLEERVNSHESTAFDGGHACTDEICMSYEEDADGKDEDC